MRDDTDGKSHDDDNAISASLRAQHQQRRRRLITSAAVLASGASSWVQTITAMAAKPALHDHQHAAPPATASAVMVNEELAQPILAMACRVIDAMDRQGEPFDQTGIAAIKEQEAAGKLAEAANAAMALLQTRALFSASITAEARVSVKRQRNSATLVQGGWRLFLARIDNPSMVPGKLNAASPNALPVNGIEPPDPVAGGRMGVVGVPTTRGDIAQRWLQLEVHDEAPLAADLEALPVDFKLLRLYARDAGRRSARIRLDIGPGTGDLGERDHVNIVFDVLPAKTVRVSIRDTDGRPVTCSLLIKDGLGHIYPSQSKRSPPDMFFQQKVYRADGQTLSLPAGEYQVVIGRGPEYLLQASKRVVAANGNSEWRVQLARWIDPGSRGWFSGDHHIHAAGCAHYEQPEHGVGPEMIAPQVKGEAIAIASVLTWGPGFYYQKLNFTSRDDAVSTPAHILHYDLEVSGFPSSHCGHLALLQMKSMDYPGCTKVEQWPSSNAPVLRWARSQGAVTGYAHSGVGLWADTTDLPNDRMPPFNGIGANDYIVTLPEGLVDFISTCNHPPAAEMNIWYHTLNVGLRSRIAGETDWPCFFEESIGMGRSYVKLDEALSYPGWCNGLRAGRSYVSEGRAHLLDFVAMVDDQLAAVGVADLQLQSPRVVTIQADVAGRLEPVPTPATEAIRKLAPLEKPYWHIERTRLGDTRQVLVELVVNGLAVESRPVVADGQILQMQFSFTPKTSCWVALRIANAAHTNPIWITVADAPIRVKRSAEWCRKAVDQCWSQKVLRIRAAERAEEAKFYDRGRKFYDRMIAEATT